MLRRIALILIIAGAFSGGMYTTLGCGGDTGSPTGVPPPVEIHGTVTNASTGVPVSGATVRLIQGTSTMQLTTSTDGRYSIAARSVGQATVEVRASGYNTFSQAIELVAGSVEFNVRLQPAS